MTPERLARIRAVLACRQPDLTVLTDHVHKGRNLSAILRNCDAMGVGQVHAVYPEDDFDPFTGTTAGSHRWVETRVHRSAAEAVASLRNEGFRVFAAHMSPRSRDYRQADFVAPTAILLGAERWGVEDAVLREVDGELHIPMLGMTESLNVSVACALILMEARRQREVAGMYDDCRLDAREYNRLMVEWGHQSVARFCQARDLPYPWLDENGDIPPAEREKLKSGT